jgi:uncharacterized circularly permuted ATP-grasp superfamily protein
MTRKLTAAQSPVDAVWNYEATPGFYDEVFGSGAQLRPHWQALADSLTAMGNQGLTGRWREGQRLIHDNGITYNVYSDPESTSRPWPLDPVPVMMDPAEWKTIEAAVIQRATLFNSILADLYGPQRLLREKMLPAELVFPNPAFLRPCCGIEPPGGVFLHMYAADLARSPDGQWWVLADRTQSPSGAGYALENRLVTTRVLPDVFRASHIRRLANFFQTYRDALQRLVPANRENPRIVLLTPGPYNETYFEHAFLARYLGYTLVEGGDLTVRDNRVYLKTLGGLLPVDVIVRRQDDQFCDPLELRGDSMLGVPALVQAVRSGNVAIANALGSGLAESAAYAAFLPGLSRLLLKEELKIPTVATWWCGQEEPLQYVLDHVGDLVLKPTFPGTRGDPIFGAVLGNKERAKLLDKVRAEPGRYVAQERVALSTVPVWEGGPLHPRLHLARQHGGLHPARRRQQGYLGIGRWARASVQPVAPGHASPGCKSSDLRSSEPRRRQSLLAGPLHRTRGSRGPDHARYSLSRLPGGGRHARRRLERGTPDSGRAGLCGGRQTGCRRARGAFHGL